MYQQIGSVTDWLDAATKVVGSVSGAVKNVKAKKAGTVINDEMLPEVTVLGTPRNLTPWLIGGAAIAALLLLRRK